MHNKTRQGLLRDNWTDSGSIFDLLITDPPEEPTRSFVRHRTVIKSYMYAISPEYIFSIPNIGNRVLKIGGYFVRLVPLELLRDYYEAFLADGYNVIIFQYVIIYYQNTIPKRQLVEFPQCFLEYLIISKHRGGHDGVLLTFFNVFFNIFQCKNTRRSSFIISVTVQMNPLTWLGSRRPFNTE